MATLKEFIKAHRIGMSADWADSNPNMSDMPNGSSHYKCRLRCGRRTMTVHFSQGPAISHEPTAEDVLDCLASDAAGFQNARSFEDWCAEYGYDTDSRKAERIYQTIEKQAAKLQQLVGNYYDELLFNTERL